MLYRGQRPEEDGERDLFLNEDGDVFIGDEVADQIDAERPFCQCLRLPDKIAQDVRRIDVRADRAEAQTATARAGRAIIAMPALTIGVVSPKVRVMDVENTICVP
jgi:hypothetical protein